MVLGKRKSSDLSTAICHSPVKTCVYCVFMLHVVLPEFKTLQTGPSEGTRHSASWVGLQLYAFTYHGYLGEAKIQLLNHSIVS